MPPIETRFTTANAREMAARGVLARKQAALKLTPEPVLTGENYTARRLIRVREQIDRVSDMLDAETDPQKLDRLAAALERLTELERKLDNRPLPGSRRPGREPSKRPAGAAAEPEPSA